MKSISISYNNSKSSYELGKYSDLSGSSKDVKFFKDDESLKVYLKELLDKKLKDGNLKSSEIAVFKKFIDIPGQIVLTVLELELGKLKDNHESMILNSENNIKKSVEALKESLGIN